MSDNEHTYCFQHNIMDTEDMYKWTLDFPFIPNFKYREEQQPKDDDEKKTWISVDDDDNDGCIHISIEDSEEELVVKEEEPRSKKNRKRKYHEILPERTTNEGLFYNLPHEIMVHIIAILLDRKHSNGRSAKESFFPPWMAQFHTFKTFRNLSHSFRTNINHYYQNNIIESIRHFQNHTLLFEPVLRKGWNQTKKNLVLQEINNWSYEYHNDKNKSQIEKENPDYLWIMFKTVVYLSSDFPNLKIKKRKRISGEAGLWVYYQAPLGGSSDKKKMLRDFYPVPESEKDQILKSEKAGLKYGTDRSIYLVTFSPQKYWAIHQEEEEAFFIAAKTKTMLCGNVKNKDFMIEEIYHDLLNVEKINVF
jgi:hypothetical protein